MVAEIEALLTEHDPQICQHNGNLYVKLPSGTVRATAAMLRFRAMQFADFFRPFDPTGRFRGYSTVDPPSKYFNTLLRKGEWRFPTLEDSGTRVDW